MQVWDDSWQVTADSDHCMRIWFDGEAGNPNDAVTRWKIQQMALMNKSSPSVHFEATSTSLKCSLALLALNFLLKSSL